MLELWISKRYLRPKGKEGFFSVITLISFLGIASSVAVLVVVMSVMNGFRTELINKIVNITTNAYSEEFIKEIKIKNKLKNVNGFHTLNFYNNGCFYDYRVESFDIFSLFYKIVAILRKKINNL